MKKLFGQNDWFFFMKNSSIRANAIFILSLSLISIVVGFWVNWVVGLIMIIFAVVGCWVALHQLHQLQNDTETYINDLTYQVERGQQEALLEMPIGMIMMDDHDVIKWINPYMSHYFKMELPT